MNLSGRYDPTTLLTRDDATVELERRAAGAHPRPVTNVAHVFTSGTTDHLRRRGSARLGRRQSLKNGGTAPDRSWTATRRLPSPVPRQRAAMSLFDTMLTRETLALQVGGTTTPYFDCCVDPMHDCVHEPVVLRRIVQEAPASPSALDYVITAAGPCSKSLAADFYDLYGPRLRQGYGMSEAFGFSSVMTHLTSESGLSICISRCVLQSALRSRTRSSGSLSRSYG